MAQRFALLLLFFLPLFVPNMAQAAIPISVSESAEHPAPARMQPMQKQLVKNLKGKHLVPNREQKTLAIILTILLPFVGIAVWQDGITKDFWITLLLTALLYLPGLIYAMSIILNSNY